MMLRVLLNFEYNAEDQRAVRQPDRDAKFATLP
jgi:hypothetical protein